LPVHTILEIVFKCAQFYATLTACVYAYLIHLQIYDEFGDRLRAYGIQLKRKKHTHKINNQEMCHDHDILEET